MANTVNATAHKTLPPVGVLSPEITSTPNAKIYWPEEKHRIEAEILKVVDKTAIDLETSGVKDHVPEVIWSHKFEEIFATTIREALGIHDAQVDRRALYIIFRKLRPITELSGGELLRAWWHGIVCHRALWEREVYHRDITSSNLKYYRNSKGEVVGVLNDYDLSSVKDASSDRERTGTIQFMALGLLEDEANGGKVEHLYQHDAESFTWVLTWVSLRCENGKLRGNGRLFDAWLTVDATGCHEKKWGFLYSAKRHTLQPPSSHDLNWPIARSSISLLGHLYAEYRVNLGVNDVFQGLFKSVPLTIKTS